MVDPITEDDLEAYVDGQLATMRRVEVEAHLARNPDDAARVMADLRDRDALREAFSPLPSHGPDRLMVSARRIDRSLAWQRVGARLRRAAVIVVLVGAGWLAHTEVGTFAAPVDPTLVEEARQARQAVQIRARSHSLRPVASYDPADLEKVTGLDLPDQLPTGWTVRDVQVFPARNGSGVEITIDAGEVGELALFATRMGSNALANDAVARTDDGTTVYWHIGETAFALSGSNESAELRAATLRLSHKN